MSHTLAKLNAGNNAFAVIKIVDYVHGGESFTLAELGMTSVSDVKFVLTEFEDIIPRFVSGVVKLFGNKGSDIPDLPSTTGINLVFIAIVLG